MCRLDTFCPFWWRFSSCVLASMSWRFRASKSLMGLIFTADWTNLRLHDDTKLSNNPRIRLIRFRRYPCALENCLIFIGWTTATGTLASAKAFDNATSIATCGFYNNAVKLKRFNVAIRLLILLLALCICQCWSSSRMWIPRIFLPTSIPIFRCCLMFALIVVIMTHPCYIRARSLGGPPFDCSS